LGLLHRLDRPVSGVILFAKTSKGASRLSEQFRAHTVEKIYHALVENKPTKNKATLINYLKKDEQKNFVTVYSTPTDGALRAELDYEVVEKKDNNYLIKIILKTGRSHQIRAQLSAIGCPIVGDIKYGSKIKKNFSEEIVGIALCATSLSFETATTKEIKTIKIDPTF